jgi:hypothetical protein
MVTLAESIEGWNGLRNDEEILLSFLTVVLQGTEIGKSEILTYETLRDFQSWFNRIGFDILTSLSRHRIFETMDGYLGIGPPGMLKDDLVCVLHQSRVILVLRKVDSHYVHIGPCFVTGVMEGEAEHPVEMQRSNVQEFIIH